MQDEDWGRDGLMEGQEIIEVSGDPTAAPLLEHTFSCVAARWTRRDVDSSSSGVVVLDMLRCR